MIFKRQHSLNGEITVPGDKSISHRAIMLGSLAKGTTEITGFLNGADCLSTIDCFRNLGVTVDFVNGKVLVKGNGLTGLLKPSSVLNVGNSGTTARLMSGILAGQNFDVTVTGDDSIQKRPMKRIITPLSLMGANINSLNNNDCAPLNISGSKLTGIRYNSPVASAQVKSAILLAGLYANGSTSVTEPYLSRNHTELMFDSFGISITTNDTTSTVCSMVDRCSNGTLVAKEELSATRINVPGDISSAAYFIAVGLIVPNSNIVIKNVGINPTRDGIITVCNSMGANIKIERYTSESGEPTADLIVSTSNLKGTTVSGEIIPTLIDEIPIIAVLAAFADGTTVIKDAAELKVKESNRIDVVVNNLSLMGADIVPTDDGMIINGGKPLHGAIIDSKLDHRIAMSFAIAGLMADGETTILGSECVDISYPDFYNDLNSLMA